MEREIQSVASYDGVGRRRSRVPCIAKVGVLLVLNRASFPQTCQNQDALATNRTVHCLSSRPPHHTCSHSVTPARFPGL
jgi:hypothetical protein